MKVMYLVTLHRKLTKSTKVSEVLGGKITYMFYDTVITEAIKDYSYHWVESLAQVNESYIQLCKRKGILPPSPDYKYYQEGDDIPEIDS